MFRLCLLRLKCFGRQLLNQLLKTKHNLTMVCCVVLSRSYNYVWNLFWSITVYLPIFHLKYFCLIFCITASSKNNSALGFDLFICNHLISPIILRLTLSDLGQCHSGIQISYFLFSFYYFFVFISFFTVFLLFFFTPTAIFSPIG